MIEAASAEFHLDSTEIQGQAYDGASTCTCNMSEQYKGSVAIIQCKYPLATCIYCCSHTLNLALVTV